MFTKLLRSNFVFPCAAIELASRNDSMEASPPVSADGSPLKFTFVTTGPAEPYAMLRWKSAIVVSMPPAMYATVIPAPV